MWWWPIRMYGTRALAGCDPAPTTIRPSSVLPSIYNAGAGRVPTEGGGGGGTGAITSIRAQGPLTTANHQRQLHMHPLLLLRGHWEAPIRVARPMATRARTTGPRADQKQYKGVVKLGSRNEGEAGLCIGAAAGEESRLYKQADKQASKQTNGNSERLPRPRGAYKQGSHTHKCGRTANGKGWGGGLGWSGRNGASQASPGGRARGCTGGAAAACCCTGRPVAWSQGMYV